MMALVQELPVEPHFGDADLSADTGLPREALPEQNIIPKGQPRRPAAGPTGLRATDVLWGR